MTAPAKFYGKMSDWFIKTIRCSGADEKKPRVSGLERTPSSHDIPTSKAFVAHPYANPLKGILYFCSSFYH
jgi:hypothetical protein